MAKGILGRKRGMTQVFSEDGQVVPVTVVEAGPCVVLQKKDVENDGYIAIQIGFEDKKEERASKPETGHAKKAGVTPKRYTKEVRNVDLDSVEVGQEIKADLFSAGEFVDVTGTSKGKGFQGSIKRHGHAIGLMSHGSRYHRGPGSLGPVDPAKVFKGTKLPGQMGRETVTLQNLEVIKVDVERNCLLIKGSIPGPKNSIVEVRSAIKKA